MCVCMCPLVVSLFIVFFRGCHRQPLYCFHLDFRCVTLIRYIYIYMWASAQKPGFVRMRIIVRKRKKCNRIHITSHCLCFACDGYTTAFKFFFAIRAFV